MATIDEIIQHSLNPFDNFAAGNFWEEQEPLPTVESIHQEALTQIKSVLAQITKDHQTRTLILYGDPGAGKTHFMGRLKQALNDQAFFVYIEPFPQSDHIWRHILRYTVDSLVNAPVGQTDSQLILWIKSCLSTIRQEHLQSEQQNLIDRIKGFFGKTTTDAKGDRQLFVDILKKTIGTRGIYNANEFFGVIYDLTNPELYSLACEWLKGDDLDDESLKKLQVKRSVDNEDKAMGILGNFSKLSAKTQPIVLCFDQLDNIARLPDGSIDLQALFNVNSAIYNGKWKGFLIIISVRTSTWNENYKRVQPADLDRASVKVSLKRITLEEAEALLASRLYQLHHQAYSLPDSPIYPLTIDALTKAFPSRKASPRQVLKLGKKLFQDYKDNGWTETGGGQPGNREKEEFQLLWQQEYKKNQAKITRITLLAAPELMRMLQEALAALQVKGIMPKLLNGNYASYSLIYQQLGKGELVGIVWTEDPGMRPFYDVMNACQRVVSRNICQSLILIRAASVGQPKLAGNQIYQQIFTDSNHRHIKPNLSSIQILATYHRFVNSALSQELVIGDKTINLQKLETFIRESEILHQCTLLQDLGIVSKPNPKSEPNGNRGEDLRPVKDLLLNLVKTQHLLGKPTLIDNAISNFPTVNEAQINVLIQQLCQENKIQILDPKAKPEAQLICLVPHK